MKMKRTIALVGALMLGAAICFSGCGSSGGSGGGEAASAEVEKVTPEDEVTAVVDGFFTTMQAGEISKLTDYCTAEVLTDQELDAFAEAEGFDDMLYESLDLESMGLTVDDLSEDARASVTRFGNTIIQELIGSYEIADISVNGDTAEVTGTVTYGYNTDFDVDTDAITTEIMDTYMAENMDALLEVYTNEGESAMLLKAFNDIMPDMLDQFTDAILETQGETDDMTCTVTKTDGKWLITDMTLTPQS